MAAASDVVSLLCCDSAREDELECCFDLVLQALSDYPTFTARLRDTLKRYVLPREIKLMIFFFTLNDEISLKHFVCDTVYPNRVWKPIPRDKQKRFFEQLANICEQYIEFKLDSEKDALRLIAAAYRDADKVSTAAAPVIVYDSGDETQLSPPKKKTTTTKKRARTGDDNDNKPKKKKKKQPQQQLKFGTIVKVLIAK